MMWVDQHQLTAKPGAAQIAQDDGADRAGSIGRADQSNGVGFEQLVEIADRHRYMIRFQPQLYHRTK